MPFTHDCCTAIAVTNCPLCLGEIEDSSDGHRIAMVNLWYPRAGWTNMEPYRNCDMIEVGLMDVRSADSLRISYDFDRDGWKIEQAWIEVVSVPPSPEHSHGYGDHADRWEEVAFIRAWGLNAQKGQDGPGADAGT